MNSFIVLAVYLAGMIGVAVCFAQAHFRYGAILIAPLFGQQPQLGDAANRLVATGMLLFVLGTGMLLAKVPRLRIDETQAIELLAHRGGVFLLVTAVIHFVRFKNLMGIYQRMRKRSDSPAQFHQRPAANNSITGA